MWIPTLSTTPLSKYTTNMGPFVHLGRNCLALPTHSYAHQCNGDKTLLLYSLRSWGSTYSSMSGIMDGNVRNSFFSCQTLHPQIIGWEGDFTNEITLHNFLKGKQDLKAPTRQEIDLVHPYGYNKCHDHQVCTLQWKKINQSHTIILTNSNYSCHQNLGCVTSTY